MEKGYNQAVSTLNLWQWLRLHVISHLYWFVKFRRIRQCLAFPGQVHSWRHMGDSMLQTLHSDTKINILNPNLNVKMFSKGVQTYLESNFSFPFVPNKKMP